VVKEYSSYIIQVTIECKDASPCLVRPNLDLVVVSPRYEKRLGLVKVDASDRPVMLFESINESSHTIIPQLNC